MPDSVSGGPRGWWAALADRARTDTEFAQSLIRFPVGVPYVILAYYAGEPAVHPTYALVYAALPWAVAASWALTFWLIWIVWRRPGHFAWRRLLAMISDNISVCTLLMIGGAAMLPTYAGLLWITVGYGMRYGPRYLLIAIAAALITCAVNAGLNPYWRANPSISVTLMLGLLITPTYAFFLHARLRSAQLAAETASLAKSRFLAQVSHDLRQPLHAVGLMTAGIVGADDPAERQDIARRIDRSVHDARELLQTFLDRSIIESGQLEARPTPFPVKGLLRELEQVNRDAAEWNNVRLRVMRTNGWIMADRAFVRTMLQNLIANAIRSSTGQSVLVGVKREAGGLALAVIDSGPGIDPLLLSRITDPDSDPGHLADGRYGGMGLGLSIVWRLAEQHGVSVRVRMTAGRGTGFVVGPFAIADAPARADQPVQPMTPLAGVRVAVVGDAGPARAALLALLEGWGCALANLGVSPPVETAADLLLIDTEAIDVAKRLRDWPAAIPLLLLSSHPAEAVRHRLGQRAAVIATKPVTAAELRSLLMAALAQRR